jgi:anti-anti-sigma factor
MNISEELLEGNVIKINLSGRMDSQGVNQYIDTKFAGMCAAPRTAIVVDMSDVPFLASIGIRSLLMNAKAVTNRGGKFVLLNPAPNVIKMLELGGIDALIPVCRDLETAVAAVS